MIQPHTVTKKAGRPYMFTCRLSREEKTALDTLLALAICEGDQEENESNRFRSILLELNGRLSRNYVKYLRYKIPKDEQLLSAH